ncbi:hypothetical protein BDW22DRAFT_1344181 [Trametopsis cervina]|nr:hypothetical protein BDW22DRAFT_1344181 [Trametopsis cervina]
MAFPHNTLSPPAAHPLTPSDPSAPIQTSTPLASRSKRRSRSAASESIQPPANTSRGSRSPSHIPRPRNAFIIFRTEFYRDNKDLLAYEKDHRHISRIIAFYWRTLTPDEKEEWKDKAKIEKLEHERKYPNYQFTPVHRTGEVKKRNVKRNGAREIKRCEVVASLLKNCSEPTELQGVMAELYMTPSAEEKGMKAIAPSESPEAPLNPSSVHGSLSSDSMFHNLPHPMAQISPPTQLAYPEVLVNSHPSLLPSPSSASLGSNNSIFEQPPYPSYHPGNIPLMYPEPEPVLDPITPVTQVPYDAPLYGHHHEPEFLLQQGAHIPASMTLDSTSTGTYMDSHNPFISHPYCGQASFAGFPNQEPRDHEIWSVYDSPTYRHNAWVNHEGTSSLPVDLNPARTAERVDVQSDWYTEPCSSSLSHWATHVI